MGSDSVQFVGKTLLFAESPSTTFSDASAKITGDRDGRCPRRKFRRPLRRLRFSEIDSRRSTCIIRARYSRRRTIKILRLIHPLVCTCGKDVRAYPYRNTSGAVLFVVNREKIDFVPPSSPATRRAVSMALPRLFGQGFADKCMHHVSFV